MPNELSMVNETNQSFQREKSFFNSQTSEVSPDSMMCLEEIKSIQTKRHPFLNFTDI